MSDLLDDILSFFGFDSGAPVIPPAPYIPMPPVKPVKVEELPVSCLVLGIIKSLETEGEKWTMERHSNDHQYRLEHADTKLGIYWDALLEPKYRTIPSRTTTGETFNRRESELLDVAIREKWQRDAEASEAKRVAKHAETHRRFETLGCPPPVACPPIATVPSSPAPDVPPFRKTIKTIKINSTKNNRKLWALLHDADPVKRKAAEEATEAVLGRAALIGWIGRDPVALP